MSTYTVYVLHSFRNGWLYIGLTDNLRRRLKQHNRGYERATRGKGPFEVIYTESFESRQEARTREKQLKSGSGREWLKRRFAAPLQATFAEEVHES